MSRADVRIRSALAVGFPEKTAHSLAAILKRRKVVLDCVELAQAPARAAKKRPLLILMPEAVYEFDPDELTALANSIGAVLVTVKDGDLSRIDATLDFVLRADGDA